MRSFPTIPCEGTVTSYVCELLTGVLMCLFQLYGVLSLVLFATISYAFDWLSMLYRKHDVTVYFKCAHFLSNGLQGVALLLCFVIGRRDTMQRCYRGKLKDDHEQRSLQRVTIRGSDVTKNAKYTLVSAACSSSSVPKDTCAASLPARPRSDVSGACATKAHKRQLRVVDGRVTDEFTVPFVQEQLNIQSYSKHITDSREHANCRTTKL